MDLYSFRLFLLLVYFFFFSAPIITLRRKRTSQSHICSLLINQSQVNNINLQINTESLFYTYTYIYIQFFILFQIWYKQFFYITISSTDTQTRTHSHTFVHTRTHSYTLVHTRTHTHLSLYFEIFFFGKQRLIEWRKVSLRPISTEYYPIKSLIMTSVIR